MEFQIPNLTQIIISTVNFGVKVEASPYNTVLQKCWNKFRLEGTSGDYLV